MKKQAPLRAKRPETDTPAPEDSAPAETPPRERASAARRGTIPFIALLTVALVGQTYPELTAAGRLIAFFCIIAVYFTLWPLLPTTRFARPLLAALSALAAVFGDRWSGNTGAAGALFGFSLPLLAVALPRPREELRSPDGDRRQERLQAVCLGSALALFLFALALLLERSGLLWQELSLLSWRISHAMTTLLQRFAPTDGNGLLDAPRFLGPAPIGAIWVVFAACLWAAHLLNASLREWRWHSAVAT